MTSRDSGARGPFGDLLARLQANPILPWLATVGWMAAIFFVSGQSTMPSWAPSFAFRDVAGHFVAYGGLALLMRWALSAAGVRRPGLWTLIIVLLYGLSDEFHQSFVPGRHPDPFDVMVDVAGAALALAAYAGLRARGIR